MCGILKVTIAVLCISMAFAAQSPRRVEMSLMQFLMDSSDLTRAYPTRSMDCFNYYLPILNEIGEEYEQNYAQCLNNAESAQEKIDAATAGEQEQLAQSATDSCQLLDSCTKYDDSISYFECFANAGTVNAKTMYSISSNASETLSEVREAYRLVQNEEYRCTNASDRVYVEKSTATYEEMQSCLSGKTPVPTTTPAPTTTTTTVATTEAEPETTTEADQTTEEDQTTLASDDTAFNPAAYQAPSGQRVLSKYSRHGV